MKFVYVLPWALLAVACNQDPRANLPTSGAFGEQVDTTTYVTATSVYDTLNQSNEVNLVVKGTVAEYCKGEGCWLTLKQTSGENLLVEIKDKAFQLPQGIEDKTIYAAGTAYQDSTDGVRLLATGIVIR